MLRFAVYQWRAGPHIACKPPQVRVVGINWQHHIPNTYLFGSKWISNTQIQTVLILEKHIDEQDLIGPLLVLPRDQILVI